MVQPILVERFGPYCNLEYYMARTVKIRHWLPIVTFCPVNHLPDLIYITVEFDDEEIHELYDLRKRIRKIASMQKMFMEDIAQLIFDEIQPDQVTVRLAFNRHVVIISNV